MSVFCYVSVFMSRYVLDTVALRVRIRSDPDTPEPPKSEDEKTGENPKRRGHARKRDT